MTEEEDDILTKMPEEKLSPMVINIDDDSSVNHSIP